MTKDSYPTSIRLARELREDLQKEARERRWSLTTLIEEILKSWRDAQFKRSKKKV